MVSLLESLGGVGGLALGLVKLGMLAIGSVYLSKHYDFPSLRWFWSVLVINSLLYLLIRAGSGGAAPPSFFLFIQGCFAAVASTIALWLVLIDGLRMLARARPYMKSGVFDWAEGMRPKMRNSGLTAVGLSLLGVVSAVISKVF